jgi:hypothetical protein
MRRLRKLSFLLVFLIIGITKNKIYAQPNPAFYGDAGSEVNGTYTVTIKKIEISKDGTNWVTLGEKTQSFNIASQSIGATIGSYISNTSIPIGTYNYLKITQSRTITIKGRSDDQDPTAGVLYYYTSTQNGTFNGFYKAGSTTSAWDNNNPPSDYEAVAFQVPADAEGGSGETLVISGNDMIVTKDLTSNPIIINEGENKSMVVSFNTQSMIGFESADTGYLFYPMPPQENYSE